MGNRKRIKGQTIQWAIDKGQTIQWAIEGQTMQWTDNTIDRQYNGQYTKDKRTNNSQKTEQQTIQ